jgi:hypothetical protein
LGGSKPKEEFCFVADAALSARRLLAAGSSSDGS